MYDAAGKYIDQEIWMTSTTRLLVVSNDKNEYLSIKAVIEQDGKDLLAEWEHDPASAIEKLVQTEYDCLLLDDKLCNSSSCSLLDKVRDSAITTPIVILTEIEDEGSILELIRAGANDYLSRRKLTNGVLVHCVKTAGRLKKIDMERHNAQEALRKSHEEVKQAHENLRETHEQLLQSEKLASIGQLAAGVAHEINNPVGYVYSNLGSLEKYIKNLFELLAGYEDLEPLISSQNESLQRVQKMKTDFELDFLKGDVKELVGECQEGITRVKQIVQDLKDFSHVDEEEWQWADLHRGLSSTLNIVNNEIKYKADVIQELGDLPMVECMSSQINQVFMNILVNAAHAIEQRGTIKIKTGLQDENIWIEISDTGSGIDNEHLKKIFDPFFTTKPVGTGTGLGLSLSYGIIKKHNGQILVDSKVGSGTTFRIELPISQGDANAGSAAS